MMTRTGCLLLLFLLAVMSAGAQRRRPVPPKPKAPVKTRVKTPVKATVKPPVKAIKAPANTPVNSTPARVTRTDTTIKGTTLEVYQQYDPELKPITKPELSPTLPPPQAERTPQQYDVPQQTLYYSYRALPLRPMALGKDTAPLPPANYALLGGGNFSTILGEAGIGSLKGRDWQSALQARYITQEGKVEGQVFRSFSLKGNAALRKDKHLYEAGIDVYRNVFGRYGYNHDVAQYGFDHIRTVYGAAALTVGARNQQPGPWGIDYHPQISGSYFQGTSVKNEYGGSLLLPVSKRIDSALSIEFGLSAWLANATIGSQSASNNIVQLTPGITYKKGAFSGHLGLYPTIGNESPVQLLPDITAAYRFGKDKVLVSAGWHMQRVQNTVQQLITANPFANLNIHWQQTHRNEIFGGLSFALGRHVAVWGRAAWQRNDPLPLFITMPNGDGKDFLVLYDGDVRAFVWAAGIKYAIGEDISLGASGTWYDFYRHTYTRVWGEPGVRLKGDAAWRVTPDLLLTGYAEVLDQIWALNAQQQDVKLKGVFEFGAAGEYTFASGFSVFLRAENLLGRRNERWLGYPSFGFNIYGGLRFRF